MFKNPEVTALRENDIGEAVKLWTCQYGLYCGSGDFPSYWKEDTAPLSEFLLARIKRQRALAARVNGRLAGFLAYDMFPFNGEDTAFCPALGHASAEEYKESAYIELYKRVSREWVGNNVLNHMWSIFFNDKALEKILFDLGFGSYLIDASMKCGGPIIEKPAYDIRKAAAGDAAVLFELVNESKAYYASAPLFLKRDELPLEEIDELISAGNVFIAWDKDIPMGFIHARLAEKNNVIDLSVKSSGLLDAIGAYIKPEYRNRNLGRELFSAAVSHCKKAGASYMHVDFETANLYANKFWRKYFTPMLLSLKRGVNRDIND